MFAGEGAPDIFDEQMKPKPAYAAVQALLAGTSISSTSSSTPTPPPTSTVSTSSATQTSTGTLPIIPESPTGLAALAQPHGKYIGSAYDNYYLSDKNYTAIVLANVNQFTCENSMKVRLVYTTVQSLTGCVSGRASNRLRETSQRQLQPIQWWKLPNLMA